MVFALKVMGFWQTSMIGETMFWFVGGAALSMPRTTSLKSLNLGVLVRWVVVLAAGLEFLANAHTFSLWVELLLVPVVAILGATAAVAGANAELKAAVKPLAVLTNLAVIGVLGASVVYVVVHLARFETAEYLRLLLLPVVLSVAAAPLIYVIRLFVLWQSTLMMLRHYLNDRPELYRYIRGRSIRLCRFSLRRADLFEKDYWRRLRSVHSAGEVDRVLAEFVVAAESKAKPETTQTRIEWDEALGSGLDLRGLLAWSVTLSSKKKQELEKAARALSEPEGSMEALADRLDHDDGLSSINPVTRAQIIRVLAERSRSIDEIELMAGEIGKLAVLEGVDPRWLADRFDAVMCALNLPAEESYNTAASLHGAACDSTSTLAEVIDGLLEVA